MSHNALAGRSLARTALLAAAGCALVALDRRTSSPASAPPSAPASPPRPGRRRLRFAATLALVACFATGGALSAAAGDRAAVALLEQDAADPAAVTPALAEAEPARETDVPPVAAAEPGGFGPAEAPPAGADAPEQEPELAEPAHRPVPPPAAASQASPAPPAPGGPLRRATARANARPPAPAAASPRRAAPLPLAPAARGSAPTYWIPSALPDPTPPARRLDAAFARRLLVSSRRAGVDWATVLGVLRARGRAGSVPGDAATLDAVNAGLLSGREPVGERASALAAYHRAVGLPALVTGLDSSRGELARRVLSRAGIEIYDGGRADVELGRIDVRVLALVAYLAERHGGVTVSSLTTGHRLYARPGVVSAHVFGHAVDIAAVGGVPVLGHQEPGGVTERALRSILLLPPELLPRQLISLLALGGPSFALADHADHIHAGY